MKKVLTGLILTLLLAGLIVPALVLAQGPPSTSTLTHDLTSMNAACTKGAVVSVELYPMCVLFNTIYTVTDWVFYVLLIVVVLIIVFGAFYFVTAAGDPEKATKGRQLIVYALIGFIIALLARLIPAVIRFFLGV